MSCFDMLQKLYNLFHFARKSFFLSDSTHFFIIFASKIVNRLYRYEKSVAYYIGDDTYSDGSGRIAFATIVPDGHGVAAA